MLAICLLLNNFLGDRQILKEINDLIMGIPGFLKLDNVLTCLKSNKHLLVWDFFVWANLNVHHKFDSMIAFVNHKNEKFGEEIFTEYLWLSKNPKVGYKLLAKALKFAKEKEFKFIVMNCVMAHPKAEKLARFYKKMGFVKDSESYIAEL